MDWKDLREVRLNKIILARRGTKSNRMFDLEGTIYIFLDRTVQLLKTLHIQYLI